MKTPYGFYSERICNASDYQKVRDLEKEILETIVLDGDQKDQLLKRCTGKMCDMLSKQL